MAETYAIVLKLLAALTIGLLVGTERGWRDRDESEGSRIAGIRTFSLIGLLGGVSALLAQESSTLVIAAIFIPVAALIIAAYVLGHRQSHDLGTTSAFAIMLVFALAAWSAYGHTVLAIATTVVVTALLGYKPTLHRLLQKVTAEELFSGIKLLMISAVLLPMLPNEGYGPWEAFNPFWVWLMVVLISGFSFAGYIAIRLAGDRMGTLITAVAGGLASSTAVTLTLSNFARRRGGKSLFLVGILVAAIIMFARVVLEVALVNHQLLWTLWQPFAFMVTVLSVGAAWLWLRQTKAPQEQSQDYQNPLQLAMALKFGALLALILLLSEGMQSWFGNQGTYALAAISGLINVDAITLSLSKMAGNNLSHQVAAAGIVLATAVNTLVKGFIFAFVVGFKNNKWLLVFLLGATLPGVLWAFWAPSDLTAF